MYRNGQEPITGFLPVLYHIGNYAVTFLYDIRVKGT